MSRCFNTCVNRVLDQGYMVLYSSWVLVNVWTDCEPIWYGLEVIKNRNFRYLVYGLETCELSQDLKTSKLKNLSNWAMT